MAEDNTTPISSLTSNIQVGVGDSEEVLRQHKASMQGVQTGTEAAGLATNAFSGQITDAMGSVTEIRAALSQYKDSLKELEALQQQGFKQSELQGPIDQTVAKIAELEARLKGMSTTVQAVASGNKVSFVQMTNDVEALKQRLIELQAVQARGREQGFFTPGLAQQISQTSSALKTLEEGGRNLQLSYGPVRGMFSVMTEEVMRFTGVSIPGMSQMAGVAGGVTEKVALLGGASTGTALAVVGVATAAIVTVTALTSMGAALQGTTAEIAAAANTSVEEADKVKMSFVGLASDIPNNVGEIGKAYSAVAGQLTSYNGVALTSAQATEIMRVAGLGAVASGEDLTKTTKDLVEQMTATHSAIGDASSVMNTMYITGRNTGLTLDEVAKISGRLEERMGNLAPNITGVGVALTLAAQAGAQGQRGLLPVITMIESLAEPSHKAQVDLEQLGVTIVKTADGGIDLGQSLLNLKSGYDTLGSAQEKEAFLTDLVGKNHGVLESMLKRSTDEIRNIIATYEDNNRVVDDAAKKSATLGVMVSKAADEARNAASIFGENLADALVEDGRVMDIFGTKIHENILDLQKWAQAVDDAYKHYYDNQRKAAEAPMPSPEGVVDPKMERDQMTGGELPYDPLAGPHYTVSPPGATQSDIEAGSAVAAQMRADQAAAQAAFEAIQAEQAAAQSAANVTSGDGGNTPLKGYDADTVRAVNDLNIALGSTGEKLHNIMTEVSGGRSTASEDVRAIHELTEATSHQADEWLKAFDPAKPEQARQRVEQLIQLQNAWVTAINTGTVADRQAAQTNIDLFEIEVNQENLRATALKRTEEYQRSQDAAARQRLAQQKAEEKAQREAMVGGLISDLETTRASIVAGYGKMGDEAVSAFVTALNSAKSTGNTEPILQAQARLAEQLKTDGVVNWQEAANTVGQAYLDALAGRISGSQAAQILGAAVGEIPKLTPQTFFAGLEAAEWMNQGGAAGKALGDGMAAGFATGGQKAIAEVQKGAVTMLHTFDVLDRPHAEEYGRRFMDGMAQALREGTPEAIAAFEQFTASLSSDAKIEQAREKMMAKIHEGGVELADKIAGAQTNFGTSLDDMVASIGSERGVQGLDVFREHMRSLLGESSEGFQLLDQRINETQARMGNDQGFRAAKESFQNLMTDRLDAFRAEQQQELDDFKDSEAAKRVEIQRTREDDDRKKEYGREDARHALEISRQEQDRKRANDREDKAAAAQLAKELKDATTSGADPARLASIRANADDAKKQRDLTRGYAIEDANLAKTRFIEDQAVTRGQQTLDRIEARKRQDDDVEYNKQARAREQEFARTAQRALQQEQHDIAVEVKGFDDQQTDEHHAHEVIKLEETKNRTITSANETYARLRQREKEHYDEVITTVQRPAYQEMLRAFMEEFADPAQEAVDGIFSKLGPAAFGGSQEASVAADAAAREVTVPAGLPQSDTGEEGATPNAVLLAMAQTPIELGVSIDGEAVSASVTKQQADRNRHRVTT